MLAGGIKDDAEAGSAILAIRTLVRVVIDVKIGTVHEHDFRSQESASIKLSSTSDRARRRPSTVIGRNHGRGVESRPIIIERNQTR